MSYIVSSGWWCTNKNVDDRDVLFGDQYIRNSDFFKLWYESVNRFSNPKKILIVDSNSPVKPNLSFKYPCFEFISLDENAGHATNHTGKFCGYTRAIFTGMGYALSCNVDYWVYIEQDALIYGDNIIENAISNMKGDFLFGSGDGTPQVLQQSLIIMKTSFIPTFLKNYTSINYDDSIISPETKFAISCHHFFKFFPLFFLKKSNKKYRFSYIGGIILKLYLKYFINKRSFNFGFGRKRPIDFNSDFFYFQHGSKEELNTYKEKINALK